jgi:hypothetical protein
MNSVEFRVTTIRLLLGEKERATMVSLAGIGAVKFMTKDPSFVKMLTLLYPVICAMSSPVGEIATS